MDAAKLGQIKDLVNADIADKKLPGAVIIVGHRGKIVYREAFGNRSLVPTVEKMTIAAVSTATVRERARSLIRARTACSRARTGSAC